MVAYENAERKTTRPASSDLANGSGATEPSGHADALAINDHHDFGIRDLASEFAISFRTLRFYEDRGLLSPRRSGSKRLYSAHDREKLRIVLLIKQLGFSLMEAKSLMPLFEEETHRPRTCELLRSRLEAQQAILLERKAEADYALGLVRHLLKGFETR